MNNNRTTAKVTIKPDEKWANNLNIEELQEFIKMRVDYILGFRGQVKNVRVPNTSQHRSRNINIKREEP